MPTLTRLLASQEYNYYCTRDPSGNLWDPKTGCSTNCTESSTQVGRAGGATEAGAVQTNTSHAA